VAKPFIRDGFLFAISNEQVGFIKSEGRKVGANILSNTKQVYRLLLVYVTVDAGNRLKLGGKT
jgi:hypothetical protein